MKYIPKLVGFFVVVASNLVFGQTKDMSYLKEGTPIPAPNMTFESPGYFENLDKAVLDPNSVIHLNLKQKNLKDFPQVIFSFKNLEVLDLSVNSIEVLPNGIGINLPKLKELYLNSNRLTSIGLEITACTNLSVLQVLDNPLESIVPEIRNMRVLHTLKLSSTNPKVKFQSAIWELTQLNYLFLLKMNIESIPSSVGNFKSLQEICVNDNSVGQIAKELYELTQLEYLGLGNNKLSSIPPAIGHLENLNYLAVFGNPISNVPETIGNFKKLEWFAAWNTKMNEQTISEIKTILMPSTKSNFDGKGIH
jgi:Leucine-rich repeat (LRR) protein